MEKKLLRKLVLQIPAGNASTLPPLGPYLGQHGMNTNDFCRQFNEQTKDLEAEIPVKVEIYIYIDKSFDFIIRKVSTTVLIANQYLEQNWDSSSISEILENKVLYKIAFIQNNYTTVNIYKKCKEILGSARSMGILLSIPEEKWYDDYFIYEQYISFVKNYIADSSIIYFK